MAGGLFPGCQAIVITRGRQKVVNERAAGAAKITTCLALPFQAADGPTNMALDQAMLDAVADGLGSVIVRTYGWTVPTLSVGYFQRVDEVDQDARFLSAPRVRRPTGGGAIWHDDELTYAVIVPAEHPLARSSKTLYGAVHGAIVQALAVLGVRAERRGDTKVPANVYEKRPLLCFTDADPEDIVTKGIKVVGSAQRRRRGAVLQHGSLLFGRSSCTPELPGLCDVADESARKHDWSNELLDQIARALEVERVDVGVPPDIERRAIELRCDRYLNPSWTGLR
jgi:lipoate-protein ligase A